MKFVNKNIIEKELFYDGIVVLKYHIEYPSIFSNELEKGIKNFNNYNEELAYEIKRKSEDELYKEAVETYKYNKANGYPVMVYEVYRNFEVTCNNYNIVSLYLDEYIFAGGAHGNTIRTSQTWNLFNGIILPLSSFFQNDPYFIINILKEINIQISTNQEIYFESTCSLVLDTFNPQNYYLIPNGIVIYFQQYDIAPYSSGIRNFIINCR